MLNVVTVEKTEKKSSVVFSSPAIRNLRAYTEKTENINVSKKQILHIIENTTAFCFY